MLTSKNISLMSQKINVFINAKCHVCKPNCMSLVNNFLMLTCCLACHVCLKKWQALGEQ